MSLEIPAFPSLPAYHFNATLDGVEYVLAFRWSDRAGAWYFDIRDPDGTPLFSGVRLVVAWPLLGRKRDPLLPAGNFLLVALDDSFVDIQARADFGDRCRLVYLTADEIAAASASATGDPFTVAVP